MGEVMTLSVVQGEGIAECYPLLEVRRAMSSR